MEADDDEGEEKAKGGDDDEGEGEEGGEHPRQTNLV